MNINNKTLHDFGNDLRDALAPLEDKYGVTIRVSGGTRKKVSLVDDLCRLDGLPILPLSPIDPR